MAAEYYNYGLEKNVAQKVRDGMFRGGYQYTTNAYQSADKAGSELGVDPKNVEVVLRFEDDGNYIKGPNVDPVPSRGFVGGATQFEHSGRPKPTAKRKITDSCWTNV